MWTDEDRDLLLALLAEEADECDTCGWPREISMNAATMYSWRVHRRTCEACRVLEAEVGNDQESKTPRRGVKYSVSREV